MTDDERRQYLSESLFLNFVSYENERLGAYMKKLRQKTVAPHEFRVPELPRHPLHVQLAVEHDGPALRRPHGLRLRAIPTRKRVLGDTRTETVSRHLDRRARLDAPRRTSTPADRSSAATAR